MCHERYVFSANDSCTVGSRDFILVHQMRTDSMEFATH
jgi:hypothetical protein